MLIHGHKILITGASGFIGRALCAYLTAAGYHTIALVRQKPTQPISARETRQVGNFEQISSFVPCLNGVDTIIHTAGLAHQLANRRVPWNDQNPYRLINVQATQHLAQAALKAHIPRFIFLSSVKALGKTFGHTPLTSLDEQPIFYPRDHYGRSKWEAEQCLLPLVSQQFAPIILRLPLVYGPGVKGNLALLCQAIQRGYPLPLGGIKNQRSVLSIENFLGCIAHAIQCPPLANPCLLVADPEPISTPDIIKALAEGMQRSPRLLAWPQWLVRTSLGLLDQTKSANALCDSLFFDPTPTYLALRWQPKQSSWDGLVATGHWYAKNHPRTERL